MVARDLLGLPLLVQRDGRWVGGTIIETEAYLGVDDAASHSFRGPTPRSSVMFGPAGIAYVYLIYGMYHCLNAVTDAEGHGSAVLIRALRPGLGESVPATPLGCAPDRVRGPGLVCRELGITLAMNGEDLTTGRVRVLDGPRLDEDEVVVGPRVGIRQARELPLRFRVRPAAPGRLPRPRSGGRLRRT